MIVHQSEEIRSEFPLRVPLRSLLLLLVVVGLVGASSVTAIAAPGAAHKHAQSDSAASLKAPPASDKDVGGSHKPARAQNGSDCCGAICCTAAGIGLFSLATLFPNRFFTGLAPVAGNTARVADRVIRPTHGPPRLSV